MEALIEKAPYLGAVILMAWIFIRDRSKESARRDLENERRDKFDLARMAELERIGKACHIHTAQLNERSNDAIDKNTRIIELNIDMNAKVISTLGAIERRMNGK